MREAAESHCRGHGDKKWRLGPFLLPITVAEQDWISALAGSKLCSFHEASLPGKIKNL